MAGLWFTVGLGGGRGRETMVQAVGQLEAPALIGAAAERERTERTPQQRRKADGPLSCAILTPSGSLLARGRVADQSTVRVGEAYALRLTDVAPRGALEALFHADRPEVVLRSPSQAELALRIDHITGPPAGRTYWLEPLAR